MSTNLRYPSLRKIRRVPSKCPYATGEPHADAFAVVAYGLHHGYKRRMRFLCSVWSTVDGAIASRDRFAKAYPEHWVVVRYRPAPGKGPVPWDGVSLSIPE